MTLCRERLSLNWFQAINFFRWIIAVNPGLEFFPNLPLAVVLKPFAKSKTCPVFDYANGPLNQDR